MNDSSLTVSPAGVTTPSHDPYRRVMDILQRLSPGRMRIAFLLGAGCPLSIREGGQALIPDIAGLTELVRESLSQDAETKDVTTGLWSRVEGRGISKPTIEDVLSHARTLISLCGDPGIDSFSKKDLQAFDQGACATIRKAEVPAVSAADLILPPPTEGSAKVAARVAAARDIQRARYRAAGLAGISTNASAPAAVLEAVAKPDAQGLALLRDAAETMRMSARGYHRVLRVARTLADLDGAEAIGRLHLAEALSYRVLAEDVKRAA